jgi:hypothetical protein
MEARNRQLAEWFQKIGSGELRLPRFQRFGDAWDYGRVAGLLETVLDKLPAGAALTLEVDGDNEPFVSRPIEGAPQPTQKAHEHLLDGQQRLTALWRSLHDNYPDHTFFVRVDQALTADVELDCVVAERRFDRGGKRYPVWADSADATITKGYAPIRLLRPGSSEVMEWCRAATRNDAEKTLELFGKITELAGRFRDFNIPFLSLPRGTPKNVALDVFVKMNTSAVDLSPYDIIVAQVEAATGQSLHDLIAALDQSLPKLKEYGKSSDFVLGVAALRQGRPPSQTGYFALDTTKLVTDWARICDGLELSVRVLEEDRVFDAARLPTAAVIPVVAALLDDVPPALDAHAHAMRTIRAYVWRAFATQRYESAAASRALQDARAIRAMIRNEKPTGENVFDETLYPLPSVEDLVRSRWPTRRDILARAILAVSLQRGAYDFADGEIVTRNQIRQREYHHLFADSLLAKAEVPEVERFRALNCVLITWKTNREFAAQEPLGYLRARVEMAHGGTAEIDRRLESHTVPFAELNVGGYGDIKSPDVQAGVRRDYNTFLRARAELVLGSLAVLCAGDRT